MNDYPAISNYRMLLASSLADCGGMAKELGRTDEAIAYFHRSRAAWQKVVDDDPAQAATADRPGELPRPLGWILFGSGRADQALEQYEAARATLQKLLDSFGRAGES